MTTLICTTFARGSTPGNKGRRSAETPTMFHQKQRELMGRPVTPQTGRDADKTLLTSVKPRACCTGCSWCKGRTNSPKAHPGDQQGQAHVTVRGSTTERRAEGKSWGTAHCTSLPSSRVQSGLSPLTRGAGDTALLCLWSSLQLRGLHPAPRRDAGPEVQVPS